MRTGREVLEAKFGRLLTRAISLSTLRTRRNLSCCALIGIMFGGDAKPGVSFFSWISRFQASEKIAMARKVRVEFEGAIYHIVCRGDRVTELKANQE